MAMCIGVVIGLILILFFVLGYVSGEGSMCSNLGGIYVDNKCMNKTTLLERR
jgi:hypothetical protein